MSADRLAEIRARAEAATSAPWFYDGRDIFAEKHGDGGHRLVIPLPETWHESQGVNKADAEFVANAREDIPWLLAEIAQLRAVIERIRANAEDDWHGPPQERGQDRALAVIASWARDALAGGGEAA